MFAIYSVNTFVN